MAVNLNCKLIQSSSMSKCHVQVSGVCMHSIEIRLAGQQYSLQEMLRVLVPGHCSSYVMLLVQNFAHGRPPVDACTDLVLA